MSVVCYPSVGKKKALKICTAFARGCAGRLAPVGSAHLEDGAAFFYGWTEHTNALIAQCRVQGREWYYGDNAYYFGRGEFFRVTRGALMHDGTGLAGPARFERFGLQIKDWSRVGDHVVIATQSELFYQQRLGMSRSDWTNLVIETVRLHTDRPIVVCDKPPPTRGCVLPHANFEDALVNAWAVVSHSSSVMVKALIEGIPVFPLAPSMADRMGWSDLSLIENPLYPDGREQWLWNLADNQWTYREMAAGLAWGRLRSNPPVAAQTIGCAFV